MRKHRWRPVLACTAAFILGCATHPDHFYTLDSLPETGTPRGSPPTLHVILDTTIPTLVDRAEFVVGAGDNRIAVLDHERWAAPLADLVQQTLARDLEGRRADLLVADRRFDRAGAPPASIKVDIARMAAQPGQRVAIEARWRVVDPATGLDRLGGGRYVAPLTGGDYAAIARAYSTALGSLADALSADLPPQ